MNDRLSTTRVLVARYRSILLGDPGTVLMLLAQAPFIGWLCTIVWGSIERDTPSLYFVLCLSAVWFGCINACREVVKERAILERERFFGLSIRGYVWSKLEVLAWLGLAQVLLMQVAVEYQMGVRGPFLLQTLALWGASLCGTGLGLLVSAVSSRQERAVGAVPLLILPQILFSPFTIPKDHFSDVVAAVEKAMPVRWAFRVFEEAAAAEPRWSLVVGALAVLLAYTGALYALVTVALLRRREV